MKNRFSNFLFIIAKILLCIILSPVLIPVKFIGLLVCAAFYKTWNDLKENKESIAILTWPF